MNKEMTFNEFLEEVLVDKLNFDRILLGNPKLIKDLTAIFNDVVKVDDYRIENGVLYTKSSEGHLISLRSNHLINKGYNHNEYYDSVISICKSGNNQIQEQNYSVFNDKFIVDERIFKDCTVSSKRKIALGYLSQNVSFFNPSGIEMSRYEVSTRMQLFRDDPMDFNDKRWDKYFLLPHELCSGFEKENEEYRRKAFNRVKRYVRGENPTKCEVSDYEKGRDGFTVSYDNKSINPAIHGFTEIYFYPSSDIQSIVDSYHELNLDLYSRYLLEYAMGCKNPECDGGKLDVCPSYKALQVASLSSLVDSKITLNDFPYVEPYGIPAVPSFQKKK